MRMLSVVLTIASASLASLATAQWTSPYAMPQAGYPYGYGYNYGYGYTQPYAYQQAYQYPQQQPAYSPYAYGQQYMAQRQAYQPVYQQPMVPQQTYAQPGWGPQAHQTFALNHAMPGTLPLEALDAGADKRGKKADDVINAQAHEDAVLPGPSSKLPNSSEPLSFRERAQKSRSDWFRSLWSGRMSKSGETKSTRK